MEVQQSQPVRWGETIQEWRDSLRRRGRSQTYIEKVESSLNRLREYLGVDYVADIDRAGFEDFFGNLQDGRILGKPLSAKTANNYLSGYNAFFGWCVKHEHVPATWTVPSASSEWTKGEHNQRRALKLDEALGIYHAAVRDELSDKPTSRTADGKVVHRSGFYWTMMCTGVRAGAAQQLRRRHFELDSDTPTIHIPSYNGGKGAKALAVPISKNDADVLSEYFERLPEPLDPHDFALTRPHPRILARDVRDAGIQARDEYDRPIGFHSFRRFHTTELFRMGADPKVVQQRLGHSTLSTTLKHYNDVQKEDHKKVAQDFGNRLSKKKDVNPLDSARRIADTRTGQQSISQHDQSNTDQREFDPPPIVDRQPADRSRVGSLPRSSDDADKRIGIGVRGFEPLATDSPLSRAEALDLLRTLTGILDRLTDDRR